MYAYQTGFGALSWAQLLDEDTSESRGLKVTISGGLVSGSIDVSTVQISESLGDRGDASFNIIREIGLEPIPIGGRIRLYVDDVLKFGGFVESTRENQLGASDKSIVEVRCVDMSAVLDRHIVNAAYDAGLTVSEIVLDILNVQSGDFGERLVDDGIFVDSDSIDIGPKLQKVRFKNQTAREAFEAISELVGFWFRIDQFGRLYFKDILSLQAPYPLDPSVWRGYTNLFVSRTRDKYRNIQVLEAGKTETDVNAKVQTFAGDGTKDTFNLDLSVARKPTIEISISGGAFTPVSGSDVGVKEKDKDDATKKWFYRIDDNEITQGAGTKLTSSDKIRVTYTGLYQSVVEAREEAEIRLRAQIEETSGVDVAVESDEKINDEDLAEERVLSLLKKFSDIPDRGQFRTYTHGFAPGQLLTTIIPEHRVVGTALITDVNYSCVSEDQGVWSYEVRWAAGEFVGGFSEYYRKLASKGRPFSIKENEKLTHLRTVVDQIVMSDNVTPDAVLGAYTDDLASIMMIGAPLVGGQRVRSLTDSTPVWRWGTRLGPTEKQSQT